MPDGDLQTQLPQILCHLQTDEAAAHHDGGPGLVPVDERFDPEGVLHGPQGEEPVAVHSGQVRPHRLCAGGQEELVVGFFKNGTRFQIFHGNGLFFGMDGGDLVADLHVDAEPPEEALRGLQGQLLRVLDDAADVIGQAAVGVGDVAGTLKNDDLGLLVQSADPCCRRGAARHAADDHNLHIHSTFPR